MKEADAKETGMIYFRHRFIYEERTDKGSGRQCNQDKIILHPELGLFGVSDGMGEPVFGEEAADLVIKSMPKAVDQFLREYDPIISPALAEELLSAAIERVSKGIFKRRNYDRKTPYGATLSCVLLTGDHAVFGNIGDSRGYIVRGRESKEITKITNDHLRTADPAKRKDECGKGTEGYCPCKRLSKFMGNGPEERPDMFIEKIERGDMILLCTNGLHNVLPDAEIVKIITENGPSEAVRILKDAATDAGGTDNISSILIEIIS